MSEAARAVQVRSATATDWPAVWSVIQQVAADGTTFAMDRRPEEQVARAAWMTAEPGRMVVATDRAGSVLGTANMYANRPAQGAHIASGSFMVAAAARGRGVVWALVRDMIRWATEAGFAAIQFNAVVETNAAAVALYRSEGFTILGTAPGAFEHPSGGRVGLHIMWRAL